MKKILIRYFLLLPLLALAQGKDYRSSEDALNQLINNPQFVEDVLKGNAKPLTLQSADEYLSIYVPEYANFKLSNKVDVSKLYYANLNDVSTDQVADQLGNLFGLNPTQWQLMKTTLNGSNAYTPVNGKSSGIASQLYERGKDKQLDLGVDAAVDFFQGEFGDGGIKSLGIDVAGGLMGYAFSGINRRYEEKLKQEKILAEAMNDYNVYESGAQLNNQKSGQEDLFAHSQAEMLSLPKFRVIKAASYKDAISLFDQAIAGYKRNPARAYFMFQAYQGRGRSKMQLGAYRSAIVDFYYAQTLLDAMLAGKLPDKSIRSVWPTGYYDAGNKKTYAKGKADFSIGSITKLDQVTLLVSRAYAKYRLDDFSGAIADCNTARGINASLPASTIANNPAAIIDAVKAMAEFGQGNYAQSYSTFSKSGITDDLIADIDGDGLVDFADADEGGQPMILDKVENLGEVEYRGLPDYFVYDIAQIRGLCYYKANQVDAAIAIYETILRTENDKGNYGLPEKRAFTKSGGDVSSVYASLGNFYVAKGDKQKALIYFDKAISIKPDQMEYYLSRANCKKLLGDKAGADNDIAAFKKPEAVATSKKAEAYYQTKIAEFESTRNNAALLDLTREAVVIYPKNEAFFCTLVKSVMAEEKPEKTQTAANAVASDLRRKEALLSLQSRQSGDVAGEEAHLTAAFEHGLGLFEASKVYRLRLETRPYYCKLLAKYATKTNNTFIAANFNRDEMIQTLDSTYNSIAEYRTATGIMKKMLDNSRRQQTAKALGEVENYLKELNEDKNISENVSIMALDKMECLFILEKDEEAIKFAKKIVSAGKIVPLQDNPVCNDALEGIRTIAKGECQ